MLHEWLQRPHVAEWWSDPETLEDVRDYCAELTNPDSHDRGYIVVEGLAAIGYIQSYVVDDDARGIDQFIADERNLGRGLGTIMVRTFVEYLFEDPTVTAVQMVQAGLKA